MKPILVDSSFLVAIYNRSDLHHARCMQELESLDRQTLVTCEAVITESLHLLYGIAGVEEAILSSVEQKQLETPFSLSDSAISVRAIMKKYRDSPADFADACLIQMADELDTGDILTLDRDFSHYRWRRNKAFCLLIPLA